MTIPTSAGTAIPAYLLALCSFMARRTPNTMVHATTTPGHLAAWQSRAGSLPPVLSDALEVCAQNGVNELECGDVLDLLAMLGCDTHTQAAALWFEIGRTHPLVWEQRAASLPEELQR